MQETLPSILLSLYPLVVASPTLYKSHYFPPRCPPFHAHDCFSWRKSPHPIMFLYFLPYLPQWYCFLLLFLFHLWTLLLFVFLFPTSKASHFLSYYLFLPPHLLHSILHYPTLQHLKPILPYCFLLLLFFSTSALPDKMPEPPTVSIYFSLSSF